MRIAIGADHGGFELKEKVRGWLSARDIDVADLGCDSTESVDYPDFAVDVSREVSSGRADRGVLVCTTGIGMSMVANRFPGVRAALCMDPDMAEKASSHNNANTLVLGGGRLEDTEARAILDRWLDTEFEGGRHERRVNKFPSCGGLEMLRASDPEIYDSIYREDQRQQQHIELIASENFVSEAVREAQGSVLTNKYAEGYPQKRWYNGCEYVDVSEQIAIDRAKELFGAEHANVQPHSGSGANMAVYFAALEPGDTIMAMSLADGGHLTHGHPMNFSGRFFNIVPYGVDRETEQIDYEALEKTAKEHKPKMLVAGASAYPRVIDFERMRAIADSVGAMFMTDMAHFAGLVAAGVHPSPIPYCDFVTTTTHKTLRGPRGGMILCREQYAADVNKQVFPGIQGGPLMHVIAAKAVCFGEALQPSFKDYQTQVVANARTLAASLESRGLRICSGGTDNHLMLVDVTPLGISGKVAATALDKAGITVNKNAIPFDTKSPFVTSGIRLGTPAATSRGMCEAEMESIAEWIHRTLSDVENEDVLAAVHAEVVSMTPRFPRP